MPTVSGFIEVALELSSRLVNIIRENADDEIAWALRLIVDYFAADCCTVFKTVENQERVELVHAVHTGTVSPSILTLDPYELAPGLVRNAFRDRKCRCLGVSHDPTGAVPSDHSRLAHFGIEALALASVPAGTPNAYLVSMISTRRGLAWSNAQLSQLLLLAEMLVGAICRRNLLDNLERAARDLSEAQRVVRFGRWEWEAETGRIVETEAIDRILGIRPETQAHFMELVHPADRQQLQQAIGKVLAGSKQGVLIEYRIRTRRGDVRIIKSRFETIPSEGGLHVTGTFHDVTPFRRGQQELQLLRSRYWHADRIARAGILVASLAHELSQPLTGILTNSQAALRIVTQGMPERDELREALTDIISDTRRATHIIDALRAMVRGKDTQRETVDLNDIVREVLALLHSELVSQQVNVELACESNCIILANKTQIEQVLLNLILNSIEAMRTEPNEERRLRLQVRRAGSDEVEVSVSDSGVGIPADQLGKVFDVFWTTKGHGLGMGLEVCRSIIDAHGGRIWAESNSSRGANFLFRLPLRSQADAAGPAGWG